MGLNMNALQIERGMRYWLRFRSARLISSRVTSYFAKRLQSRWPLIPLAFLITALHIYRDGETMLWTMNGAAFILLVLSWPFKTHGEGWGDSAKSNPR